MPEQKMNEWLSVERPARYAGHEWNIVVKEEGVRSRILLCFPNTYEIGMSHLGMRILYGLVNGEPDLALERVFAPWGDREEQIRTRGETLKSLETERSFSQFDLVGFTLQTELDFTNILSMLDLGGLPLRAEDRHGACPLVIAGGPVAFNPEPLAPFIDAFVIGDGEKALPLLMRKVAELKEAGSTREEILDEVSSLEGVYVPSAFQLVEDEESGYQVVATPDGQPAKIRKAVIDNLDDYPFPEKIIVPNCDIVHDRVAIEISRGCRRGCRFCQAGVIYMPERQRSPQSIVDSLLGMLDSTGYSDVSISALTPNDYDRLRELVASLMERFEEEGVAMSFASLSPQNLDKKLLEMVKTVRKTGITIAPEAGTQRMRDVINKGVTEEDILRTARTAFSLGWKTVKLYFMIGLPTETDEDVLAIAELAKKVASLDKGVKVKIGCSNFVPKCHTPFQWVAMDTEESLKRKKAMLLDALKKTRINFTSHDIEESLLEGVLSNGDRRVADTIQRAWELGCRFDGWSDRFRLDLWKQAFAETGVDEGFYLHRSLPPYARLPWSHIDTMVSLDFLQSEFQKAMKAETAIRCAPENCSVCRACPPHILKKKWQKENIDSPKINVPPARLVTRGEAQNYRFCFTKGEEIRTLGHLDLAKMVARVFRRAGINVAMSQGFHPQPRISFSLALPLGQIGLNEYFDARLIEPPTEEELVKLMNAESPKGLKINAVSRLDDRKTSLSAELAAADYIITRTDGEEFDEEALKSFLALESLEFKRRHKGKIKKFDIRGMVLELEKLKSWDELRLQLRLGGGIQAKPTEVIEAVFNFDSSCCEIIRNQLYIERNGQLLPPIVRETKCQKN